MQKQEKEENEEMKENQEESIENKVAGQTPFFVEVYKLYGKTDLKLMKKQILFMEEILKTQFCFWRVSFPIRPKYFKRDLLTAAKGCNLQPRAQKTLFEGSIQTLLECLGLKENIKKLQDVLSKEDPNLMKLGLKYFNQSQQSCYLNSEDIEENAALKYFLYSENEMKRMKSSSDYGSKIFAAADLMQKKEDKAPIISKIVQKKTLFSNRWLK